jgi:hypothetical protein
MKKIIIGACILLVTVMFSPAMAQDGPNKRLDRQGDRINGKGPLERATFESLYESKGSSWKS